MGGGIAEQTFQALKNVTDLLQASGSTKDRILKVQVYLADIDDFQAMNAVYSEFFEGTTYPARTTVGVAGLPGGIGVEIDAIASLGG